MKKIMAVLLMVVIGAFFAACGDETQTNTTSDNIGQMTTTQSSTTTTEGSNTSFDTSWAKNEFEKLIPELPFDDWKVKSETDTVYELEVTGLNTSAATNPPDSGEKDGADKDALLDYLNTLTKYNFMVEEISQDYKWLATDGNGNEIEFMIGDGGCWVTITKK